METIKVPSPQMTYERKYIDYFKGFDWSKATKEDSVQFAQAFGFPETGMSVNEIALIYDVLEAKKPRVIVEIGRNYGCSTRIFLQYLIRHPEVGAYLESWDLKHWPGFIEKMNENGYKLEADVVTKIGQTGSVFLRTAHSLKAPVTDIIDKEGWNFLLIDSEHGIQHPLSEWMRFREYLRGGSIVAFHDSTLSGVKRAIEIIKEVEASEFGDRFQYEYINEHIDGFGVCCLELKG